MSAKFMTTQEKCQSEKKAYATPDVTVHGKVETITAGAHTIGGSVEDTVDDDDG